MNLSVIIVNWNTRDLLRECLKSVLKQTKGLDYEVLVVDNGSSDDSVRMIKKAFPWIKLMENRENLGFSKANNQAIRRARGEFILLLNSDTKIAENAFKKMVDFARANPQIGVLGPRLLNADGNSQASTAPFYFLGVAFLSLFGGDRFLRSSPQKAKKVDWVSGSCFLIRRELLDKVGGLDEQFFMYLEEMEFCYRAKKVGFETWFLPWARVYHLVRGSSPEGKQKVIWWTYENFVYFYQKHFALWQVAVVKWLLRLKAGLAWGVGVVKGDAYLRSTYGQAFKLVR
jgi:GT2 family glycosyltransferase